MVSDGHNFVAATGRSGDGSDIGLSGTDAGGKGIEIDVQSINFKIKSLNLLIEVLKTGFDGVAVASKATGGILTDSVSKMIIGGLFMTASHIEMTPINVIAGRVKGLGLYFLVTKNKGEKNEARYKIYE